RLKVTERSTGADIWTTRLSQTNFNQFTYVGNPNPVRWPYQTVGHVIVMQVGYLVFAIDPLGKRVLWERSLLGSQPLTQIIQTTFDARDSTVLVSYQDGWRQRLGQPLIAEATHVCLPTRDVLVVVDPITGRTLWTRTDVPPYYRLLGDERFIYLVETD